MGYQESDMTELLNSHMTRSYNPWACMPRKTIISKDTRTLKNFLKNVGFKHTHHYVRTRSSRTTYCKAQETLLSLSEPVQERSKS